MFIKNNKSLKTRITHLFSRVLNLNRTLQLNDGYISAFRRHHRPLSHFVAAAATRSNQVRHRHQNTFYMLWITRGAHCQFDGD